MTPVLLMAGRFRASTAYVLPGAVGWGCKMSGVAFRVNDRGYEIRRQSAYGRRDVFGRSYHNLRGGSVRFPCVGGLLLQGPRVYNTVSASDAQSGSDTGPPLRCLELV